MQQSGFDVFSMLVILLVGASIIFGFAIFVIVLVAILRQAGKSGNRQRIRSSAPFGQRMRGGVVNGVTYTDTYVEMTSISQPDNIGGRDDTQVFFGDNSSSDAGNSVDFSTGQDNGGGADFSSGQDNSAGVDFGNSGSSNDFSSSSSSYDSGGSADFSSSSSSSSDFSSTSSSDSGSSSGGDY